MVTNKEITLKSIVVPDFADRGLKNKEEEEREEKDKACEGIVTNYCSPKFCGSLLLKT